MTDNVLGINLDHVGKLEEGQHRLAFLQTDILTYPEMYSEVYIQCDAGEERMFAEMLIKAKCYKADSPETADFVIFGGGVDVNPLLYDEECHPSVHFYSKRDEDDIKLYEYCLQEGIPMLGICRGAQFLHVMNGGKLFQDVDGHNGAHQLWDCKNRRSVGTTSSVHHQMVRPNKLGGMEVLADARISKTRWKNKTEKEEGSSMDIEAFFYRDTCCLGIQGHPEYRGYAQFTQWSLQMMDEYFVANPDLSLCRNGKRNRALSPQFLAERNAAWGVDEDDEVAPDPDETDVSPDDEEKAVLTAGEIALKELLDEAQALPRSADDDVGSAVMLSPDETDDGVTVH